MYVITVRWKAAYAKKCHCKPKCVYSFKDKEWADFFYDAWSKNDKVVDKIERSITKG